MAQIKSGVLMHGGSGGAGFLADTWLWANGGWTNVTALGGGVAPPGRSLGAMAAFGDGALLFGGYLYDGQRSRSIYILFN